MSIRLRRHPVLYSFLAFVLLGAAAVAGVGWYLVLEERRIGRLVARVLTDQAGIPIAIERVTIDGPYRFVFKNVRVPPGKHWGGDVRVRELRVEGGLMPLAFPRGRSLAVVLVSTAVTLAPETSPTTPPTVEGLEAIRRLVMQVIEWPAVVSVRIEGGELRARDEVFSFDLKGEKTAAGALGVTMSVSPAEGPPALKLSLAGRTEKTGIAMRLGIDGEPSRLGKFWPETLPALTRIALDGDGFLRAGGEVELTGTARAERTAGEEPLDVEFASRYHAAAARLDLSRLVIGWGPDLRVRGSGNVDIKEALRVALDYDGSMDGAEVKGRVGYDGESGALALQVEAEPVDVRRLFTRLGLGSPPAGLSVRRFYATFGATVEPGQVRLSANTALDDLEARAMLPGTFMGGALVLNATLDRGESGPTLATLGPTTLTLRHAGAPMIEAKARSRGNAAWPVVVEMIIADLRRLPSVPAMPTTLQGSAVITGDVDASDARGGPRFTGTLAADVPRAEIQLGSPVVVTNARLRLPISYGAPPPREPGTLTAERIQAFGFVVEQLQSPARFADETLQLEDIRYLHYGGSGRGSIEAAVDGRPVPLKARVEGEHIDLARLTREYGLTVAKLNGKVRYLMVMNYSATRGIIGAGQVSSEEDGGEVGIEPIEQLLQSASVQKETTGLLRQTLQNLRVFRYSTLEADVRVSRDGARLNLSLEGKKRLGIFPAPVKAINFANVPILTLARTFARKERP